MIVVIGVIGALGSPSDDSDDTAAPETTTVVVAEEATTEEAAEETTTEEEAAETTTEEGPEPPPEPAAPVTVLRGSGSKVEQVRLREDSPLVVTGSHRGSANFIVVMVGTGGADDFTFSLFNEMSSARLSKHQFCPRSCS